MKHKIRTSIFAAIGMFVLILDTKTALQGAVTGLQLCIYTVIPSLLPFFILSFLLTSSLIGEDLPFIRPLGRICGIPKGAESLLMVGILGGYPAGAGCIAQAYREGAIKKQDAQRMLPVCNLAGPAFLFGIIAAKMDNPYAPWALWGIHIISAILVSLLLPGRTNTSVTIHPGNNRKITDALQPSLKIMASVCGWIILFRVIIAFVQRWFLWFFPLPTQVAITGALELANGCFELSRISESNVRFLIAAWMLGFGGLCVFMQTASVANRLGLKTYFWGKVLQGSISLLLAYFVQFFLFAGNNVTGSAVVLCVFLFLFICFTVKFLHKKQKRYSISPLLRV